MLNSSIFVPINKDIELFLKLCLMIIKYFLQ